MIDVINFGLSKKAFKRPGALYLTDGAHHNGGAGDFERLGAAYISGRSIEVRVVSVSRQPDGIMTCMLYFGDILGTCSIGSTDTYSVAAFKKALELKETVRVVVTDPTGHVFSARPVIPVGAAEEDVQGKGPAIDDEVKLAYLIWKMIEDSNIPRSETLEELRQTIGKGRINDEKDPRGDFNPRLVLPRLK
jgi:hypothetical protein